MCGIAGFSIKGASLIEASVGKLLPGITRRGPDGSGHQITDDSSYCFVHTRLAIIELSEKAKQPMSSPNSNWLITFNGEIYNFRELKKQIEIEYPGVVWRSDSDTELLATILEFYGIEKALGLIRGMFAFAAYELSTQKLYLVRDIFGEKPLYYKESDGSIVFASDVRSIWAFENGQLKLEEQSVKNFLKFGYIFGNKSIFSQVNQVPPACFLEMEGSKPPIIKKYWKPNLQISNSRLKAPFSEVVDNCEKLITSAIKSTCTSDVPVGFLLSGGIDSSLVCSIASENSNTPIDTYTIAFDDEVLNEADVAENVAKTIGANHKVHLIKPDDLIDTIPRIVKVWGEPFADPSQLPMVMLSEFVSKEKKVVLSGDGGDELFCGYNRYNSGFDLFSKLKVLPPYVRKLLARMLTAPKIEAMLSSYTSYEHFLKFRKIISCAHNHDYFEAVTTRTHEAPSIYKANINPNRVSDYLDEQKANDFKRKMMYADLSTFLPGSVLTKVDRSTMYFGLEARAPLLDRDLADYITSIDTKILCSKGISKHILKHILKKYQDESIWLRPKQGFNAPISDWLRGPLREWAEYNLFAAPLKFSNYLDEVQIKNIWNEFMAGDRSKFDEVWVILMFVSWLKTV